MRAVRFAVLGSCVALSLSSAAGLAATPEIPDGLRPPLVDVLKAAADDARVPVSIVLHEQARPEETAALRLGRSRAEGRGRVLAHLRDLAARTQAPLLARLRTLERDGAVARLRPLYIGNVVGVDATPAVIREIARRPEVAWVNHNPKVDVFTGPPACVELPGVLARLAPATAGGDAAARSGAAAATGVAGAANGAGAGTDDVECGTNLMQAPRVWNELGNTGAGAVIAVIDTGVCWTHPDIANQIWVNPGEDLDHDGVVMDAADMNGVDDDGNGYVDDLIGWNFDDNTNQPQDVNGHGSHCAGSVAGDGTSGTQTGVAPDTKIMVVRVGVSFADEVDVWGGMQYAAQNGADSISMSLGWPHGQSPDRETWRNNCESTINAGTAMVIAAGNEGSGAEPDNVRTPGDVPRVITVAAVDCSDGIAGFSSRGPVTWQNVPPFNDWPYPPGLVKPDVAGPGVDTLSSSFCSGYTTMSGTSMATPHVAGAVALMVAASPGLEHDTIKEVLEATSVDLGAAGKDNEYGAGRVDAYEAVLNSANPAGRVGVKQAAAGCGGVLDLTVTDENLRGAGTTSVTATSTTEWAGETVTLTEVNPGSGQFKGTIALASGAAAADGLLQVAHGDTATATYLDADDGTGAPAVSFDTAAIDCTGPAVTGVGVSGVTDQRATVHVATSEPASAVIEWGTTPALGQSTASAALAPAHDVFINQFDTCQSVYFRVRSTDAFGNESIVDAGGVPFRFQLAQIPGLYWRETFEGGAAGWTLNGEWQVGAPQGEGGSSLLPDPAAAYNNAHALGGDLNGTGSFPGDYEPNRNESARGPTRDPRLWTNTKLTFRRQLNTLPGDTASIYLWVNGVGRTLYRTDGQQVSDDGYQLVTFDVARLVDGATSVFIEFKQQSDGSGQASGWNIDDVVFKDGTLPDYDACGGCGAPPSFAGVAGVADGDGCAAGGLTVTWDGAASWGSGRGGTYAVYRGATPDFVPGPSNLLVTGLTSTSWHDAGPPADQPVYYVVRAENDEACGGGPHNGGVVDGNTRRAAGRDATTQVLPGAVSGVDLRLVGHAHVRLEWAATADAARYRVRRSLAASSGFAALAEPAVPLFEDAGAGADAATYFYLVGALDACGNEGP